jgi:catechol 2,3-dioxygenase-like lactoylglutathione lyase family enzyme
MAFHHVAIASRDIKASHEFYTGAMGFTLVKAQASRSGEDGWAKHLFYDTGGQGLMALWDLHDDSLPPDWRSAISDGLGLPRWVNHIAFEARDRDDLERGSQAAPARARRRRHRDRPSLVRLDLRQ